MTRLGDAHGPGAAGALGGEGRYEVGATADPPVVAVRRRPLARARGAHRCSWTRSRRCLPLVSRRQATRAAAWCHKQRQAARRSPRSVVWGSIRETLAVTRELKRAVPKRNSRAPAREGHVRWSCRPIERGLFGSRPLSLSRLDQERMRDREGLAPGRQHGRSGVTLPAIGLDRPRDHDVLLSRGDRRVYPRGEPGERGGRWPLPHALGSYLNEIPRRTRKFTTAPSWIVRS